MKYSKLVQVIKHFHLFFRCAQKIVTQLETVPLFSKNSRNYRYERLPQTDREEEQEKEKDKKWWNNSERSWQERSRSEERIDNKKNELVERQMELKERSNSGRSIKDKGVMKKTDKKNV